MDSFEFNKIVAAIILTVVVVLGLDRVSDLLFKVETLSILDSAKTILWNGPMGVFENKFFEQGTRDLSETIANSSAFSIPYTDPAEVARLSVGCLT